VADTAGKAAQFGIVHNNNAFFGLIDWLQENRVAKILAEPNIVAVSGRPAQFNVGGEIPIVVPQSLGTATIEFKPFGTQIDFLPIVLGNGNIRLEVRPRISEIDEARSVVVQNFTIPSLTVREVDTAVEMKAGQTFALAGLVQEKTETLKRGLPYVSDWPVVGVPFRKMENEVNEIELLILVTPEFVDPMDGCEVPCGGPGTYSVSPTNCGFYCAGQMEVPPHVNPIQGLGSCGGDDCQCHGGNGGCSNCSSGGMVGGSTNVVLPGGTGYDDGGNTFTPQPALAPAEQSDSSQLPSMEPAAPADGDPAPVPVPPQGAQTLPDDLSLPIATDEQPNAPLPATPGPVPATPVATPVTPPEAIPPQAPLPSGDSAWYVPPTSVAPVNPAPVYTAPRPYSPQRQPVFLRNASRPHNPQIAPTQPAPQQPQTGLIGPVGYDVQ
jgi:pilus assembly protein CpaC